MRSAFRNYIDINGKYCIESFFLLVQNKTSVKDFDLNIT